MANAEIPLFDLKATESYVFAAGGGGSREYGKDNGIVAIRKELVCQETSKIECFYKTRDFITSIQVYESDGTASSLHLDIPEHGSSNAEEDPSSSDSLSITEQDTECTNPKELGTPKNDSVDNGDVVAKKDPNQETFIAALGDECFYFLRFTDSFVLLNKIEKKIRMSVLNRNLFLLCNCEVYGFYNAISSPSCVKIGSKAIKEMENSTEEYLYKLVRDGNKIVFKNESGTDDVASDWESFFIYNGNIHKVVLDKGRNVFVFKNEKYEIEGKMSRIVSYNDSITFFSNTSKEGMLYFIGGTKKIYKLPKITTFGINKEKIAIATCEGDAVIYSNGDYVSKAHVSSVPVTGIAVDNERIYFSVLTGEMESVKYRKCSIPPMVLIAIVALLLGVFLALFKYI